MSTRSPLRTSQSYNWRCCAAVGCSSSHTSAPRPDGRNRVIRSVAPYLAAREANSSSWSTLWRVTTTEIFASLNPAAARFSNARTAMSNEPAPRTASFTSAVAPSSDI
ncbi:Uncharacterised protein [Mycobacteroides abscessus subsp. abscessus]|nr:Uncharacterised protein [Mycobacteroides abscessus subsp. abscessus]